MEARPVPVVRVRASVVRLLAWVGIVLGLAYLVLVAGSYAGLSGLPARVTGQVVVAVLLGGWALAAWWVPAWRPASSLRGPILLGLAALAMSAFLSPWPRLGMGAVVGAAVLGVGVLAADRLAARPWFRPRLEVLLVVLPVALAGTYVAQAVATWIEWWGLIGAIGVPPLRPAWAGLTLGSPNLVATLLLLTTPVAASLVLVRGGPGGGVARGTAVAAAAIVALGLAATALTGSRGGALGAGAAVGLAVAAVVLRPGTGGLRRRLPLVVAGLAGVAVLGAALLSRMAQGGGDLRFELWRASLAMVAERPLSGVGPGAWGAARLAEAQPWVPTVVVTHAHNLVLHTVAELGLVGVAAAAVLVLAVVRVLLRGLLAGGARALVAGGVGLGLTGVAVQSTVDVVTNLAGIVLLIGLLVALAEHRAPADPGGSADDAELRDVGQGAGVGFAGVAGHGRAVSVAVVALVLLGAAGIAWWAARADLAIARADSARAALQDGDAVAAVTGFAEALALDDHPLYRIEWAVALAHARDPGARAAVEVAAGLDALPHHRLLLADARLRDGDAAGAIDAARTALEAGWPDPNVLLNAGRIAAAAGDRDLAREAYVRAAAVAPLTLGDPYWTGLGDVIVYDDLVARAAELARARLGAGGEALVLAHGGRGADARAIVAVFGPADRVVYGALVTAVEDPAAAIASLEPYVASAPTDWYATAVLAALLIDAGRPDDAAPYARRAEIVQADAFATVILAPRRIAGPLTVPQFRLSGDYPWPVYQRLALPVLIGPDAVVVSP